MEETTNEQHSSSSSWAGILVRTVISVGLIAGAFGAFALLGQGRRPEMRADTGPSNPLVETATVEEHATGIKFEVDGIVIPFRQVEVAAEIAGRVEFKSDNCRVGRTVEKGELLMRLDAQDCDLEIRRLKEDLKRAKASLNELDVQTGGM